MRLLTRSSLLPTALLLLLLVAITGAAMRRNDDSSHSSTRTTANHHRDDDVSLPRFLQQLNNETGGDETEPAQEQQETCPPCPQCQETSCPTPPTAPNDNNNNKNDPQEQQEPLTLQILVVDSIGIINMVKWNARDYEKYTNGAVSIVVQTTATMPALFQEIENDARTGASLFDAYFTNPVILGTAAMNGGFLDLTPFVKESPHADWTDVLLALRTYVTSFEDKIYIILLDGDTHTLFYRRDVLEHFGLQVPRTWNEYAQVAKAVHGKEFAGQTLYGSCVSRIAGDHAMYWSHLLLSTITQTQGTATGSLFDTADMTPLTGHAMAEMLRLHEVHNQYGAPDEFTEVINYVNNVHMNEGRCVLSLGWGDMFRRSNAQGSILHDKLGIAPTPGSEVVLNRATGKLERCTRELCPYAIFYDDIGFVNSAPYAANGGWGAAISANTSPEKQKALADFFLWASSRDQSDQYVIPNSTLPWYEINGQDPWRKSHLDVDKWVAQGFDRELSKQYVESILTNLVSKNVVVEARFPKAGEIMGVLDKEVHDYLLRVHEGLIDENDRERERLRTAQEVTDQWNQIIKKYNERGDTVAPILEVYQRLRGVYVPNEEMNHLEGIHTVGWVLLGIILLSSIGSGIWVYVMRNKQVVRVSQPIFLGLICLGTFVMGSSIVVMGIDDEKASQEACNKACMATPWLFAVGFSICFSALFSKIWRLNRLMKSAVRFRRIQVSIRDVMLPFAILLLLNVAFLLTWTIGDPLEWVRISKGRTESGELESYGHCESSTTLAPVMLGLVGGVNLVALALANIQAYQTRNLTVAYDESRYVTLAMASILQAFLIGLPVLFLADDNPVTRYVVRSLLVFVICMSVLGFIFIPKMIVGKEAQTMRNMSHFNASNKHNGSGNGSGGPNMSLTSNANLNGSSMAPTGWSLRPQSSVPVSGLGESQVSAAFKLADSVHCAELPEEPVEADDPDKKEKLKISDESNHFSNVDEDDDLSGNLRRHMMKFAPPANQDSVEN